MQLIKTKEMHEMKIYGNKKDGFTISPSKRDKVTIKAKQVIYCKGKSVVK